MTSLIIVFAVIAVVAVGNLIWLYTPSGKRWLDSLDD